MTEMTETAGDGGPNWSTTRLEQGRLSSEEESIALQQQQLKLHDTLQSQSDAGNSASTRPERFMFHSELTGTVWTHAFETIAHAAYGPLSPDVADAADAEAARMTTLLGEAPFWLDVTTPSADEMYHLRKIFRLHPLTVEDIMTEDTREKCELYPNYTFCVFNLFDDQPMSEQFMEPISLFTVVTDSYILSFHQAPCSHAARVARRLVRRHLLQSMSDYADDTESESEDESAPEEHTKESAAVACSSLTVDSKQRHAPVVPSWVNYALLDDVVDGFAPLLGQLQLEVDSVDELVLVLQQSEQADMLRRLGEARRRSVMLGRLLTGKPDVLRSLIKRRETANAAHGEEEDKLDLTAYLSDILDHLIGMVQNVVHFERILSRAHGNYLAQINVELAKVSDRTNTAIVWITTFGTVLVPMHVIAGIWGMNVNVPGGEDSEGNKPGLYWFFAIMLGMVIISSGAYLYFRPKRTLADVMRQQLQPRRHSTHPTKLVGTAPANTNL